jgi:hypothetical protein
MNKKLKIFLAALFVIALMSFLIFKVVEYKNEKEDELNYLYIEDFTKTEVDGKTVLENKDIGLKFTVPQGWETGSAYWSNLSLVSPDFEPLRNDPTAAPFPQKGCWIDLIFSIDSNNGISYEFIDNLINIGGYLESYNEEGDHYEIVEVDGLKAIKDTGGGDYILIRVPFRRNGIISFETYLRGQDKEKCIEEFNSLINTVSIK